MRSDVSIFSVFKTGWVLEFICDRKELEQNVCSIILTILYVTLRFTLILLNLD